MSPTAPQRKIKVQESNGSNRPVDINMSHDITGPNKQRRRRVPISCSVCRQRKLKCDKGHPCNSCLLRGTAGLCSYAERPWIRDTNTRQLKEPSENELARENRQLCEENRRLRQLLDSVTCQPSLGSVVVTPSEQFQTSCLKYGMIGNKKSKQIFLGPLTPLILCFSSPEIMNLMRCAKQKFKAVGKANGRSGHSPHDRLKGLRAQVTAEFSLPNLGHEKDPAFKRLVLSATRFLPPAKTCRLLIDRFFSHVYTLYALLDPDSFHEVQDKLLDFSDLGERFEQDSSLLDSFALLFVILLLAKMSFYGSTTDLSLYERIDLVDAHYTSIAESLLVRNGNLKKCSMNCLCALVYIRLCRQAALQEGDGGDGSDSDIFCGIIFHSASSMGLHRDPEHFSDVPPRTAYLWRKLWVMLLSFDAQQSLELGRPLTFHSSWYDTLEPTSGQFVPLSIRQSVLEKEEESIYVLSLRSKAMLVIRRILEQLFSVASLPSAESLVDYVRQIDDFCILHFSAICDAFSDSLGHQTLSRLQLHSESTILIGSYCDILKVKLVLLTLLANKACDVNSSDERYLLLCKLSSTAQQLSLSSIEWIDRSEPGDPIWSMVPCAIQNVRYSTCFLIWLVFQGEGYEVNDKAPDFVLPLPDIIEKTIYFLRKFPDSFSAHRFLFFLPEILNRFNSRGKKELRGQAQVPSDMSDSKGAPTENLFSQLEEGVADQEIPISDDWIKEMVFWQDYLNF